MDIPYIKKFIYTRSYKYTRYNLDNAEVIVAPGDKVSENTVIARGFVSKMMYRLNVSFFTKNIEKYINVVHGQVIQKGDIVVLKRSKSMVSPVEGIIDLSDIKKGDILIRSYPEDISLLAGMDGNICNIYDNKIIIETQVVRSSMQYIFGGNVEAKLKYIAEDNGDLNLDNINSSCIGSIIYVGSYITLEIIKKSVAVGVVGIIGTGIEIKDNQSIEELINAIPLTVAVVDGFSRIDNLYFSIIKKFSGHRLLIDTDTSSIIIPCKINTEDAKVGYIRKANINDKVQIFTLPFWGYSGKIVNISGDTVNVMLDKGNDVSVQKYDIIGII
jgi:preprotein translocase subunit YajC